jgi:hypothetical protein
MSLGTALVEGGPLCISLGTSFGDSFGTSLGTSLDMKIEGNWPGTSLETTLGSLGDFEETSPGRSLGISLGILAGHVTWYGAGWGRSTLHFEETSPGRSLGISLGDYFGTSLGDPIGSLGDPLGTSLGTSLGDPLELQLCWILIFFMLFRLIASSCSGVVWITHNNHPTLWPESGLMDVPAGHMWIKMFFE